MHFWARGSGKFGGKLVNDDSSCRSRNSPVAMPQDTGAGSPPSRSQRSSPEQHEPLDVVLVGCGLPHVSMGWFHLTQLLDHEHVRLRAVVEPFFLSAGRAAPGANEFNELRRAHPHLHFCASLDEISPATTGATDATGAPWPQSRAG